MLHRLAIAAAALSLLTLALVAPSHGQELNRTRSASYSATNATTVKVITGQSKNAVYITGLIITASAAGTAQIEYGTGSNCGTGTTTVSGALALGASAPVQAQAAQGALVSIPAGQDVCIVSTGTATFAGLISYFQY